MVAEKLKICFCNDVEEPEWPTVESDEAGRSVREWGSGSISWVRSDSRSALIGWTHRCLHPGSSGDAFGFFRLVTQLISQSSNFLMQSCHFIGFESKWRARISPFNLLRSDLWNIRTLCVLNYVHLIDVCLCFLSVFGGSEWERQLFYELSLYANSGSCFQRLAKLALRLLHSGITYWFCWPFFLTLTDSTGWLMFTSAARLFLPPSDWCSMLSLLIGLLRRETDRRRQKQLLTFQGKRCL